MINVGDKLPDAKFTVMGPDGPKPKTVAEVFAGKKVALFAVPGAYTPTCSNDHMPGFVNRVDELKAKGIDAIACTAVNDVFVLTNWAKDTGAAGKIEMLADGSGDFAFRVGIPGKSGVGGGILGIVPGVASLAVWSPGLNENGNSKLGSIALEKLARMMNWSIFAP